MKVSLLVIFVFSVVIYRLIFRYLRIFVSSRSKSLREKEKKINKKKKEKYSSNS